MTLMVRPVNLHTERVALLTLLERNLDGMPHARRFDWLYYDNPIGTAWAWFVYEKETQKAVGAAALFPHAMWVGGKSRVCGQVGDFAIDIGYRSLGPALMLQRATFKPVQQGLLVFCYDCPPHDRGMSTFRRLGLEANCRLHRYALPLRTDRQLIKHVGRRRVATFLASLGNRWLQLQSPRRQTMPGLEICLHTARFGEEFSWLDQQVGGNDTIRSRRAAEDLNWRYRENPLQYYHVLTARLKGELMGFVVFFRSAQDVYIVDLFGYPLADPRLQLLHAVSDYVRREPIQTVHMLVTGESDVAALLPRAGFRYRAQATQVVAYTQSGSEGQTCLAKQPRWSFHHVDVLA